MQWDGSFLGRYRSEIILTDVKVQDLKYFTLNLHGIIFNCIYKATKDKFPCIVDELKPIFGLVKLGTHTIKIDSKLYLLIKCDQRNGVTFFDHKLCDILPLIDIKQNHIFRQYIQEVFMFREIMGLTVSFESSVRIRYFDYKYLPVSFREPSNHLARENEVLPKTILNKWFWDYSPDKVVQRMITITNEDEIAVKLAFLRTQIENVITRIDKEQISISLYIMDRIYLRLELGTIMSEW